MEFWVGQEEGSKERSLTCGVNLEADPSLHFGMTTRNQTDEVGGESFYKTSHPSEKRRMGHPFRNFKSSKIEALHFDAARGMRELLQNLPLC